MFKKLKGIFKGREEKNSNDETETSERKIRVKGGSEKVEWDTLENNPGYIASVTAHNNSELFVAYILYGILEEKGWDVELLNGKYESDKWIYVKDNGYYLFPLLINFSHDNDNGFKIFATIQIHHKEIFPDGIFEYIYPQKQATNLADGLFDLFNTWVDLDWETLDDCLKLKNSKYMSMEIELEDVVKHVFYGPVLSYPNVDVEKLKVKGIDPDPYIDEFCPCCLFTNSMEAFDAQIKDTEKNYAVRLFATKNVNGEVEADCRINGEEYPQAEEYLKKYASTWKECDIIKIRKQYIIIRNGKDKRVYS